MPLSPVRSLALTAALALATLAAHADPENRPWSEITAAAKGQTVYWNAWGGDERTNTSIGWVGDEVRRRYGVTVQQFGWSIWRNAVTATAHSISPTRRSAPRPPGMSHRTRC